MKTKQIIQGLLLAFTFFGLALILHLAGTGKKPMEISAILGCIFLITSLIILLSPKMTNIQPAPQKDTTGYQLDDDENWSRILLINGREVRLSLPDDERFDKSRQYADAVDNSITTAWMQFKSKETSQEKNEELRSEINAIKITTILFNSARQPDTAEVYMESEKTKRCWKCLYRSGKFYDLSLAE